MARIDLRYLILVAAFYAPGAMMALGALALGFSVEEFRLFVGMMGGVIGMFTAFFAAVQLFSDHGPIWWEFRK